MRIMIIIKKFVAGEIQPGETITSLEGVIFTTLTPNKIRIEFGGRVEEWERCPSNS